MDYRPPSFRQPVQYDIPGSLDQLFESYIRGKQQEQVDTLQGLALRDKFGVDPRGMSPEQLDRGFAGPTMVPQPGPAQPGQPGPQSAQFDQDPHVAAIQRFMQNKQKMQSVGMEKESLGLDLTRSQIAENQAKALKEMSFAGRASKAPTGFRATQTGDLEPIPGGPADIKLREQEQKKDIASSNLAYNAERMIAKIDELVPRVGMTTTGVGSITSGIPATPAKNFAEDLRTLQANIGFQALNAMREASKTGGALGQVTERELAFLQATVAALDPSQGSDQLRKNLMEVRDSFKRTLETARSGGTATSQTGARATAKPTSDPLGLFQ